MTEIIDNNSYRNGADLIISILRKQGVEVLFGYPGGTVIDVYDALYRDGNIRHILTSHEQSAAHAADGYARSTGKCGVCLVTSGPGATNLVTGIATAYMDSVPLVAITINVAKGSLGKDSFQEVDIAGIVMPVTKHSFIVKSIENLAPTLKRAFSIAKSGRPGPVLVDITRDVTQVCAESFFEEKNISISDSSKEKYCEVDGSLFDRATKMLSGAKKPLILAGGGTVISKAGNELGKLSEMLDIPVTDTLMGKGAISGNDERYLGMAGMHGTNTANYALANADLILAVGTRFSDRVTGNAADFAPNASIIQIDIDKAELNKNVRISLGIRADAATAVSQILMRIKRRKFHDKWWEELHSIDNGQSGTAEEGFLGSSIIRRVYELSSDAIISTEVGENQMYAANYFRYSYPGQLLTSGGLGTMGYGLGAAIGAKIGNPSRTVINIAGDGCFRMNLNELMTASRYKLPVIEIIFDNSALGMVRTMQKNDYDGRICDTEFTDAADYCKIAEAMGAKAYSVSDLKAFEGAYLEALTVSDRPCVIVCDCR